MINFTNSQVIYPNRFKMTVISNSEEKTVEIIQNEGAVYNEGTPLTAEIFTDVFSKKQDKLSLSNGAGLRMVDNTDGTVKISQENYDQVDYTHIAQPLPNDIYDVDYKTWTYTPRHPSSMGSIIRVPYRIYQSFDMSFQVGEIVVEGENKYLVYRLLDANDSGNFTECIYDMDAHVLYFYRYENDDCSINQVINNVIFNTFRIIRQTRENGGYIYKFFDGNTYVCQVETSDQDISFVEFGTNGFDAQLKFWKIRG